MSGFSKKLCDTCLCSFVPWHLKQIHNRALCPDCLKLVADSNDVWPGAAGSPVPDNPVKARILQVVKEKGDDFILEAAVSRRIINAGFLAVILGRILLYSVLFPLLESHHIAYYIFKGVIMADFVTWLIIGIMEISLTPGRFAVGFAVNMLIIAYVSQAY